jgi:formate-dependent nitrite reductase membrane component NrfD
MVPKEKPRSYHGRPVIKESAWTWEVPWYLFTGGLAGASAVLGFSATATGNRPLARRAWLVSFTGITVSPALLVADLGRPERFINMLRVFKPTSPMSVGSWVLAMSSAAITPAAYGAVRRDPPLISRLAEPVAAALGLPLATYTAILISNTVVPVWSEARRELPFVFASSAAASAGAAAVALTPSGHAGPARRLAVAGAVGEVVAHEVMVRRLGPLISEPYREKGRPQRFSRASAALSASGAALIATGRRSRARTVAGAAAVLAGAVCQRWAVYTAGFPSARDPRYTVEPQRARMAERSAAG